MEILRTRFKKDIVCEFIPPFLEEVSTASRRSPWRRGSRRGGGFRPAKVIILCYGMPGVPKDKATMEFWSRKGFWVFFPRYRGTWESDGEFLKKSPHLDILDVINELPKGFDDLWSGKRYKVQPSELYIFGGSFGGPSAILCSRDPRVTKAVAFAPVIDWKAPSKEDPMDKLGAFLPRGFGNGYRFSKKNWERLSHNEFYSPISLISSPPFRRGRLSGGGKTSTTSLDGKKLLIFHAKDDSSVPYSYTKKFAEKTSAKLITLRTGGHFGFSKSIEPAYYKHLKKFLQTPRQRRGR